MPAHRLWLVNQVETTEKSYHTFQQRQVLQQSSCSDMSNPTPTPRLECPKLFDNDSSRPDQTRMSEIHLTRFREFNIITNHLCILITDSMLFSHSLTACYPSAKHQIESVQLFLISEQLRSSQQIQFLGRNTPILCAFVHFLLNKYILRICSF